MRNESHNKQALEATNSLDDYARMEAGVDPVGPRECLITFVSQYEQLRAENEQLKVELAEAKKDAMCWYMTKQWHHADTIARIEESAKQATKGK